jgi:acyl-CoA thioester hydrolase
MAQTPVNNHQLAEFPVVISLPVIWGDMDAFQHVNNTVYVRWFESSRVAFVEQADIRPFLQERHLGPILASVTCNFKRQLRFPDTVHIGARVANLGRSSMTLDHVVYSETLGQVAADGSSIVVLFDYQSQRPVRIPQEMLAAIERLQGSLPAGP